MLSSRALRQVRRERGAATVEVALSMLLLIPTALYAIYAGEAFLAGTRAQEAEISATWDITGFLLHDYDNGQDYEAGPDGDPSLYVDVTQRAANRIEASLSGMDSYRGGGNGQQMVISRQRLDNVDCRPMDARYILNRALLTYQAIPYQTREYLHRGGYVVCSARVRFSPQLMPRDMRGGYTSKVNLLSDALANGFSVCGNGSTLWGCAGEHVPGIITLTNDWGLEDGRSNPVGTDNNPKYYKVGEKVFNLKWERAGENDIAGGIGSQQVTEAMRFMLDEVKGDWGRTSEYKLAFYNDMSRERDYPDNDHGGQAQAHVSPWDDGEGSFTSDRHVYSTARSQSYYLGHRSPNFLDSPKNP
ncbi:hypothetical protein [Hyalangium sp.]|uniref:TadE/TadG family type IV pilus assembly protein n=1 Tax=Hyalangium sp. TaxID=2028555 RepID=UPI002D248DF5|nr:hypothetical protein [Hyalangium sp.]HYH95663.1 hypothetical protein [Hyalangium sp.]